MATCSSCGQELRDDVWTCGSCGVPVSRASARDTYVPDHTTEAPPMPARPGPKTEAREGGLPQWFWITLATVAVVAVAGIAWYSMFWGGNGDKFVGSWTNGDGSEGTFVIAKSGSDFTLTMVDPKGQQVGPFEANLRHGKLESNLSPAGDSREAEASAALMRAFLGAFVEDLKLVFTYNDAGDTVTFAVEGKSKIGGDQGLDQSVSLHRVAADAGQP